MSAANPALGRIDLPRRSAAVPSAAPSPAVEVSLFAALAFLGLVQWSRLIVESPMIKLLFALAAICAGARLLLAVKPGPGRGLPATLAAAAIAIATLALALMLAGMPARLLLPANWGELGANIADGLRGIEDAPVPYAGSVDWIALDLALAGPAIAAVAAAVAFWPAANRGRRRVFALMLLIASFAIPVTLYPPGGQLFWGVVLLIGSASWLWIGRLSGSRRNLALAVTLATGVVALPVAARAADEPLLSYKNWDWFGGSAAVAFQWDHEYGPLDWQRDGATMMSVETDRALYWKASVLDRFDGVRWQRASPSDPLAINEVNVRRVAPKGALTKLHPGWVEEARFQIEGLQTSWVVGAGVPLAVTDIDVDASRDGTLVHPAGTLEGGTEYAVVTYDPNPTVDQLQSAPASYPAARFAGTTLLSMPNDPATIAMPLWGTTDPTIEDRVLASPYEETYRLARTWAAEASTPYEAVTAIVGQLRQYAYTPEVPVHQYPLPSFLFQDRAGYCQQFAGSLALMLRMLGIPARVVSGFAPGTPDSADGTYEVHDFDAHSWVEVFFRGIGWVTFDPTPAAAPAESQRLGNQEPEIRGGALLSDSAEGPGLEGRSSADDAAAAGGGSGGDGSGSAGTIVLVALALIAAAGGFIFWRLRRREIGDPGEARVAELRAALAGAGWHLDAGTTLLALEERVAGSGRRALGNYARALRRNRFERPAPPLPDATQRRAMRRALIAGGPLRRLRAWILVPPGGPRPLR